MSNKCLLSMLESLQQFLKNKYEEAIHHSVGFTRDHVLWGIRHSLWSSSQDTLLTPSQGISMPYLSPQRLNAQMKSQAQWVSPFHYGCKNVTVQESLCVCGVLGTSKNFHMNIAKCGKGWRAEQWEWRQREGFRIILNQSNGHNMASWRGTWWT